MQVDKKLNLDADVTVTAQFEQVSGDNGND